MDGFRQIIANLKDELAYSAGIDPLADRFKSGAIQAYNDILNTSFDDVEENISED